MQNCLFIGVDVALKGNQFCVMNFDQTYLFSTLNFPIIQKEMIWL